MTVTTADEEADMRIVEFVRVHRSHFHYTFDSNGISTEPFGVWYGKED